MAKGGTINGCLVDKGTQSKQEMKIMDMMHTAGTATGKVWSNNVVCRFFLTGCTC